MTDVHVAETRAREGERHRQKRSRAAISGVLFPEEAVGGTVKGGVGAQFSTLPSGNAVGPSLCYGAITSRYAPRGARRLTARLFTGIVKTRTKVR